MDHPYSNHHFGCQKHSKKPHQIGEKIHMSNTFPTLYATDTKGKTKVWSVSVMYGDPVLIITTFGYLNGKMKTESTYIHEGKNLGKANETSPYEQAIAEAKSKITKKLDDNYTEIPPEEGDVKVNILPMLAHPYAKRKHDLTWPAYVQPKLYGCRLLAHKVSETEMDYISRGGKKFTTLGHLTADLLKILEVGEILDGEIYMHQAMTFQEIVSALKKKNHQTEILQYHIYDLVDLKKPFSDRTTIIKDKFLKLTLDSPLQRVETVKMYDEDEMFDMHNQFTVNGYEGTMIRNTHGMYVLDYRSKDLLKYKDFIDEEFKIVGGTDGKGSEAGCVIFLCECHSGRFSVRPRGTREQRTIWLNEIDSLKGKKLTVRFQRLSDDGIPIFPVGIIIRDYE